MKNTFSLEIMRINRVLNNKEQQLLRTKFQQLLNLYGINSIRLETNKIYVEYNPYFINLDSIRLVLLDIGFPIVSSIKLASILNEV